MCIIFVRVSKAGSRQTHYTEYIEQFKTGCNPKWKNHFHEVIGPKGSSAAATRRPSSLSKLNVEQTFL